MNFVEILEDTDLSMKILNDVCKRSRPGRDKITFKKFKNDFNEINFVIKRKIINETYHFTKFETTLKTKKHYQLPRLIFKSTIRDKYVAKLMYEYLKKIYEKNNDIVKLKSRYYILQEISKLIVEKNTSNKFLYNGFIRLDISSYYDSINRHLLKNQLYNDCKDDKFLILIDNLFFTMDISKEKPNGCGIPQGISVSSILAERYLSDFDKKYNVENNKYNIKIMRYVDDILILIGDLNHIEEVKQKVIFDLCSTYGLKLNEDKMEFGNIDDDYFEFLGSKFQNRKVSISDKQMDRIKKQLIELFKWYKKICHDNSFVLNETRKEDVSTKRLQKTLVEKLNLLITGYFYQNEKTEIYNKYGWVLTSLPRYLTDLNKLKELDKYVDFLVKNYLNDDKEIKDNIKSFYMTFINFNFNDNCYNYVLYRNEIEKDEQKMYRITCNLSMVDIKKNLDYNNYNKDEFEAAVDESLKDYFRKTLYISNRNLTTDILYW